MRRAEAHDAAAVASLLGELGYPTTEAEARERLDSRDFASALVLVASEDDDVVGLLAADPVPYFPDGSMLLRITALVVTERRRRSKVGQFLIDAAAAYARDHGCSALEVTTAERRTGAHRFYESLGFTRTGLRFLRVLVTTGPARRA